MSLHKTYRLRCDGVSIAAREDLRTVPFTAHEPYGPSANTSQRARRAAKSSGWERAVRKLPLADGTTTPVKYDLCPSCALHIGSN